jgi:hypothetical protein
MKIAQVNANPNWTLLIKTTDGASGVLKKQTSPTLTCTWPQH